jgi:general secretion pathway protein K
MTIGKEKGVALITVLFVVAVATLLGSQLFRATRDNLERTQWLVTDAQAYQYALGGEQMARQLLFLEWERLRENGLNLSPRPFTRVYEPHAGRILIDLVDNQGLVNLNNAAGNKLSRQLLDNFLTNVLALPDAGPRLADWVDGDQQPRPGGAEDYDYLDREPPYRAADQRLAHASEMLAVVDMEPEAYAAILPHLTAIPQSTPLNINSAPPELIGILVPGISSAQFDAARSRRENGFTTIQQFLRSDTVAGLGIEPAAVTVNSSYYEARTLATFAGRALRLHSRFHLNRTTGQITLLGRDFPAHWPESGTPTENIEDPSDHDLAFP